jgi:hypothetical protein
MPLQMCTVGCWLACSGLVAALAGPAAPTTPTTADVATIATAVAARRTPRLFTR